ncbi:fatty acid desaturase family protein [Burkholderia plantarii]|uniref:fatty acid desaturase family protein n=1 Tax=Burkholderia plantarii TaxID=41899 RepID=UPI00272D63D2|nr:fatty acid desaturase family protein [Burkholderia plantarii]WLE62354.1 fatty acid desaturase family protein [Burkholderia plantarii]
MNQPSPASSPDAAAAAAAARPARRGTLAAAGAHLAADLKVLAPLHCARQIAWQWIVTGAAIAIAEQAGSIPVTVLALIVIATRQHALLVLMHDASHYLLSRDKRRNDLLASLLLTFPLTISTSRYRAHHLAHHRHLNTPDDPDYADAFAPPSRAHLWRALLRDVTGLSTLQSLRSMDSFGVFGLFGRHDRTSRIERRGFVAFAVAVAGLATLAHAWLGIVLYWLAPMVFFLPPILRIRSLSEHAGLAARPVQNDARSVAPGPLERMLFAPCNINCHWEHHLFPQVPSYRLRALQARLAAQFPDSAAARRTHGYLLGRASMLAELYPARPVVRRFP